MSDRNPPPFEQPTFAADRPRMRGVGETRISLRDAEEIIEWTAILHGGLFRRLDQMRAKQRGRHPPPLPR